MPPNDRQSEHAARIKFERDLMDATGMTRQQVRRALPGIRKQLEEFANFVQRAGLVQQPAPVVKENPKVETTETKQESSSQLTPAGLVVPPAVEGGASNGSGQFTGIITTEDGVLKYAQINGIVGAELS